MIILDIVKVFLPSVVAFVIGITFTPLLTNYLYKNEMWKKKSGKIAPDGRATPIFNELHKNKEVGTPKMGGIVIWFSAFVTIAGIWFLAKIFPNEIIGKLDFLSRNQTWIPLFTLIAGSLVGLVDDFMEIKGSRDHIAGGLSLKKRLFIVALIALFCSLWFYFKLNVVSIGLPDPFGEIFIGWLFIPFFIIVTLAIYSGGVIDGLDGLAGGIFATIFSAYAGIAFFQNQINLAAFCTLIVGSILAFLWFNIPPARYYMSETGTMGLTITLVVVAFMTDSLGKGYGVLVLPIIALPLIVTSLSSSIQLLSKKIRNGKKVFLVAPIHHHFEAIGWPATKVTMRFWIIGIISAILGMILGLIG
jgi:phospho-N-acetylmuramoyl-pentapeptide-transferase